MIFNYLQVRHMVMPTESHRQNTKQSLTSFSKAILNGITSSYHTDCNFARRFLFILNDYHAVEVTEYKVNEKV